jgi:hypothetical protein
MSTTTITDHETMEVPTATTSDRREFLKAAGVSIAALGIPGAAGSPAFAAGLQTTLNKPAGAENF